MTKEFFEIVVWIPVIIILSGVIVGFSKFKLLGTSQKYLVLLLSLALLAELVSYFLSEWKKNSYPVFHIYAIGEYFLLSQVFSNAFHKKGARIFLKLSIPLMILYGLLNLLFWQPINTPNSNFTIASNSIMILIPVWFLFTVIETMRYNKIERSSMFWIATGTLIYFSSSLLMFFYMNWLVPVDYEVTVRLLLLNVFFNVIHYICFNLALWMDPE